MEVTEGEKPAGDSEQPEEEEESTEDSKTG